MVLDILQLGNEAGTIRLAALFKMHCEKINQISLTIFFVYHKFIQPLNPSVFCRTDTRGVNLNRQYLNPDFELHPSVYGAKSILLYHHVHNRVCPTDPDWRNSISLSTSSVTLQPKTSNHSQSQPSTEVTLTDMEKTNNLLNSMGREGPYITSSQGLTPDTSIVPGLPDFIREKEGWVLGPDLKTEVVEQCENSWCGDLTTESTPSIPPQESGIAFYVDLHGHASKRGCFMYGNCFSEENDQVRSRVMYPITPCNIKLVFISFLHAILKKKCKAILLETVGHTCNNLEHFHCC